MAFSLWLPSTRLESPSSHQHRRLTAALPRLFLSVAVSKAPPTTTTTLLAGLRYRFKC